MLFSPARVLAGSRLSPVSGCLCAISLLHALTPPQTQTARSVGEAVLVQAVNETNAAELPVLLATRLLPDMDAEESALLERHSADAGHLPISNQLGRVDVRPVPLLLPAHNSGHASILAWSQSSGAAHQQHVDENGTMSARQVSSTFVALRHTLRAGLQACLKLLLVRRP